MHVFNKITLQGLKKNRTRTLVTIIGVILSVAMIAAVTTFIASLQNDLIQREIEQNGDWEVKFFGGDAAFVEKARSDSAVKTATVIQNFGYSTLVGGQNPDKPYLFVAGLNDSAYDALHIELLAGRLPGNGNEILIPEHILTNGGVAYQIGDTLMLSNGERMFDDKVLGQNVSFQIGEPEEGQGETLLPKDTTTYTVVGICARPSFEQYSAPGYTVITKTDIPFIDESGEIGELGELGESGNYDVLITLKSPAKVYEYAEKTAGNLSYEFNRGLLRFYGVSTNDNFNTVLYSIGGMLIALIMIGGILLIYNSFAISVSERARQFGILSSVGATKRQLQKSVLFEGICIGAIGIPLGLIAGVGGIGITLRLISDIAKSLFSDTALSLHISLPALIIAAVMGVITILISAYIPARVAVKKSPIEIIRQTDTVKINPKAVKTSKVISLLFGLEGMLALKNFKRNKKRYRSTVISLFVSVVLFVAAGAFGMYLKQGTDLTVQDFGYDLSFNATQGSWHLEDEQLLRLYSQMKDADGIYKSAYYNYVNCSTTIQKSEFTERFLAYYSEMDSTSNDVDYGFSIYFIDDGTYRQYLETLGLSPTDYGLTQGKLPAVAKVVRYDNEQQRTIAMNVFNERNITLEPNTTFYTRARINPEQRDLSAQNLAFTISDTMPEGFSQSQVSGLAVFAPYSDMVHGAVLQEAANGMSMVFSSHAPMKSAAEMEIMIKEAGISVGYNLFNAAAALVEERNILLVINIFTYGFVILISLITIANVFNTVSTSIHLRRREFAMLRSIGLSNCGFDKMMTFECIFYGLKALLYGLPVATGITWLIYKSMMVGVDVSFQLPWGSILISVFSVFFVVFVTMLYAVSKVKKANVIDALREEAV
ncbi:ABC transporter permease [Clostridia bacterium]|nr:ABC transporter permease [Clostridia bacterium]